MRGVLSRLCRIRPRSYGSCRARVAVTYLLSQVPTPYAPLSRDLLKNSVADESYAAIIAYKHGEFHVAGRTGQ